VVGRWLLSDEPPPPPSPPTDVTVEKIAVVSGVYEKVAGWQRLQEAEDEAAALRRRYGGADVEATTRAVLDCLKGAPPGDVVHFALHGKYDPNGVQHGLALVDGQMLDPAQVEAYSLASRPFVFLNACQVGAAEAILGDYAGMAASFLYAGASAVIAPLWSIDDKLAHSLAVDFYKEALTSDGRPAEILARYRRAIGGGDGVSGTYLAYQFFGHPRMRLAAERLAAKDGDEG
jgi:CHAT domain-containing protein